MKEKFKELQDRWPNTSSLLIYFRLIKLTPKENWSRRNVTSWFNKLVDPEDYEKAEKKLILNWMAKNMAQNKGHFVQNRG